MLRQSARHARSCSRCEARYTCEEGVPCSSPCPLHVLPIPTIQCFTKRVPYSTHCMRWLFAAMSARPASRDSARPQGTEASSSPSLFLPTPLSLPLSLPPSIHPSIHPSLARSLSLTVLQLCSLSQSCSSVRLEVWMEWKEQQVCANRSRRVCANTS
jgi:hypothetical protein